MSPVSSVIPAMDTIDCTFTTASMDGEQFSLPIKVGLEICKWIMNKYYNLMNESEIYQVSIGISSILFLVSILIPSVLHPGLKTWYFKDNKWPQEWHDEAVAITRWIFDNEYQDLPVSVDVSRSSVTTTDAPESNKVSSTNLFMFVLTLCVDKYFPFGDVHANAVLYPPQVNPYGLYGMGHGLHGMGHGLHGMGHGPHGMGHGPHGIEHGPYGIGHGVHGMEHGPHGMEHGPYGIEHGVHGMGHGVHGMEHEVYGMAHGTHRMKHEV